MSKPPANKKAAEAKAKAATPPEASPLLRIRAYARSRNVSAPTIVSAIREGKIVPAKVDAVGPLIDPATADKSWYEKRGKKKRGAMELVGVPRDPEEMSEDEADKTPVFTTDGVKVPTFFQSKTLKEHFAAKRAELEFEKSAGKLIDAETVKRQIFELGRKARDRILAIPDRVSAMVAAEVEPAKVHAILAKEFAAVAREIAAETSDPQSE